VRSKSLHTFLLQDPIVKLSKEEEQDIQRRLEMDRLRLEEQKKFAEESKKRAKELDKWLRGFKKELIQDRKICLSIEMLIFRGSNETIRRD